jgi:hypothetical protein
MNALWSASPETCSLLDAVQEGDRNASKSCWGIIGRPSWRCHGRETVAQRVPVEPDDGTTVEPEFPKTISILVVESEALLVAQTFVAGYDVEDRRPGPSITPPGPKRLVYPPADPRC